MVDDAECCDRAASDGLDGLWLQPGHLALSPGDDQSGVRLVMEVLMPDETKTYDHGCGSGESCNLDAAKKGYMDRMMDDSRKKSRPQDEMMGEDAMKKDWPGRDI